MTDNQKDKSVEKEFKFSGNPARQEGESFEEYKARKKLIKKIEKEKLRGKMIWPSKGAYLNMGTFYKEFKGHEEEMVNQTIDYMKAAEQQSKEKPAGVSKSLKDKNND
jgi:hypothetical protein|tara:strand:- start:1149 stop:1472 length:324 start_codon:yes stop_codon:yes gene_type:complete